MKSIHKLWLFLIVAIAATTSLWSRQQPSPDDKQDKKPGAYKVSVKVNMVNVPVTVRKQEGGFIKGLKKEDFRLYEDGVPQEITLFAQEGLPTRIAIVLDISGSVRTAWGTIMHATKRFVEHLHEEDRFALFTFNTDIRLRMDWGNKTDRMEEVLGSIYCKGYTKIWDTIWAISGDALKGIEEKKAVIIMSDGLDNQSEVSYEEAVEAAVRSEAAVYIVSKTEAVRRMANMEKEKDPYLNVHQEAFAQAEFALRKIAEKTGGRVLYPNLFDQLDDVYEEVDEELRNQYTLGYISNNASNDGSYRNIEVRVNAPGASVSARPGYYAPNEMPADKQ
jgi:Ca-activated chloride channel family protein